MSLAMSNEKLNSVTVARGHLDQEDELTHGECVPFFLCRAFHKASQHHQPWLLSMEKNSE